MMATEDKQNNNNKQMFQGTCHHRQGGDKWLNAIQLLRCTAHIYGHLLMKKSVGGQAT